MESKILVLGCSDMPEGVSAFRWDQLPASLSVADFDFVVADLVALAELEREVSAGRIPTPDQVTRLLFSGGELVIIGNPNTPFRESGGIRFTDLLPGAAEVVEEVGDAIRDIAPDFEFYFERVNAWSYYTTGKAALRSGALGEVKKLHRLSKNLQVKIEKIASTRFNQPIGWYLRARSTDGRRSRSAGDCVFLPPPTEGATADAIRQILVRRFGIGTRSAIPGWCHDIPLPEERRLAEERDEVVEEREQARLRLAEISDQLSGAIRFKRLLYASGVELEEIVCEALGVLGAAVERPNDTTREDATLIDPFDRSAVVEIKGKSGSAAVADVRQVDHWARDLIAEDDWEGRSLLIVNAFRDRPPTEREALCPPNVLSLAKRFEVSVLDTVDLFEAIVRVQNEVFDAKAFWDTVLAQPGLVRFEIAPVGE